MVGSCNPCEALKLLLWNALEVVGLELVLARLSYIRILMYFASLPECVALVAYHVLLIGGGDFLVYVSLPTEADPWLENADDMYLATFVWRKSMTIRVRMGEPLRHLILLGLSGGIFIKKVCGQMASTRLLQMV